MKLGVINSDGKISLPISEPEGFSIDLIDLRFRGFANTPYNHLLVELAHVDAAERLLSNGADAIYIDSFADYGLERIRSMTDVPVVGAGESSLRRIGKLATNFSIVTVWPRSMQWLYDERLANCPEGKFCNGVHYTGEEEEISRLGTANSVKSRMIRNDNDIIENLASACRNAISADGTEAVLLGCTCMSPIAEKLQQQLDFPVIDPCRTGIEEALSALAEKPTPSVEQREHPGIVSSIVDSWLAAGGSLNTVECQVCEFVINQSNTSE